MNTPEDDHLRNVIERALRRELLARRDLKPHVQLAIPVDADAATVEDAYRRLRGQYDSAAFAQHGPGVMAAAVWTALGSVAVAVPVGVVVDRGATTIYALDCSWYPRGTGRGLSIVDRAGLETASCECYRIIRNEFDRLLGPP